MATNQTWTGIGTLKVVDKRKAVDNVNPLSTTSEAAAVSIATLDAQLTTYDAAYYTQAHLDSMTYNDKIYALRFAYDSAGI